MSSRSSCSPLPEWQRAAGAATTRRQRQPRFRPPLNGRMVCAARSPPGRASSRVSRASSPTRPRSRRRGSRGAADDAKAATDTFADDLEALGTPDTESGEDIRSSVDELSTTVQTEVDSIESAVGDVSESRRRSECSDGRQGIDRRHEHCALVHDHHDRGRGRTRRDQGRHRQLARLRERHELRATGARLLGPTDPNHPVWMMSGSGESATLVG